MSDLVVGTDVVKDYQERVADLERRVAETHLTAERAAEDASILVPIAQEFITRAIERGDHDAIRNALHAVLDDTGIDAGTVADALNRMSVFGDALEYLQRQFIVHVTLPVSLTVEVMASDYAEAEEAAYDEVYSNGLEAYCLEAEYYQAEYYVEEA